MPKTCSIDGCEKPVNARGYCGTHYQRWRTYGDPLAGGPVVDRMKRGGPCAVDGCDKPSYKRGYCNAHYQRFRTHGDPLGGGTPKGEPQRFLEQKVLPYEGDECLIWPYAKNEAGYAQVVIDGRRKLATREVCERLYGPPPSDEHVAAHSCGKGKFGCVNPNHLRWATNAENEADKIVHGTSNRGERNGHAILTSDDVIAIRQMFGKVRYKDIASQYDVGWKTIASIAEGRLWSWLN